MNIKLNKKYLLLIPLVVSVIMLTFFSAAYDEIVHEKREQRFQMIERTMDMMLSQIDRYVAKNQYLDTYEYTSALLAIINEIDAMPMVFVEVYDQRLTPLTDLSIVKPFDLREYPEFMEAIGKGEDSSPFTITYDDGTLAPYQMDIYFREVPAGDYENKLICVVGVSDYAIDHGFQPWLIWGTAGLILMTVLLQLWMVLYISKLSDAERLTRDQCGEAAGGIK